MNKNKFILNVGTLQSDMYNSLKKIVLKTGCDVENYKWVSDLSFICSCEQEDYLYLKLENVQADIISHLEKSSDDTAACYLLSLCGIAYATDKPQLCVIYKDRYEFRIKENDVSALWIDAIGTAAVLCRDSRVTGLCIEKSHELVNSYTRCKKNVSLATILDDMSHIAHFDSVCMEYGYEKEELSYTLYSKLVSWYTQSLYSIDKPRWFQNENDVIYPDGDMLIHIASLPDSSYHSWLNRFKVLARYLFDTINLPNEYYHCYSVLNINKASEKCMPFEASLPNLDLFSNNEIIITDDQQKPKLKLYFSPQCVIKAAYNGEIVYKGRISPYSHVRYADIIGGDTYVIYTQDRSFASQIYILTSGNCLLLIDKDKTLDGDNYNRKTCRIDQAEINGFSVRTLCVNNNNSVKFDDNEIAVTTDDEKQLLITVNNNELIVTDDSGSKNKYMLQEGI